MSRNPNVTAQYVNIPPELTDNWRKYILQGATPNDTKLDFTQEQKAKIPRGDFRTYDWAVYPRPYTEGLDYETDLVFFQMKSPAFDLWVEKIKICLHQEFTYGCVKVNVWDFGSSLNNTNPTNIVNVDTGQPSNLNCPVTLIANEKLISNALAQTDLYMVNTGQECELQPFDYTIEANSVVRMGIQYAEGNGYGLKVFIVGWALECDTTEEESS
jgi:hypothetical protein